LGLEGALDNFNKITSKRFVAVNSPSPKEPSYIIDIHSVRIATKGEQTTAALVTALGLALPVLMITAEAPLFIAFWMNSSNRTYLTEYLSENIRRNSQNLNTPKMYRNGGSWGRTRGENIIMEGHRFKLRMQSKLRYINMTNI